MAQRTENEETEFKVVPETLTMCINNCGFTGNPATNNMCQKCYNNAAKGILVSHKPSESSRSDPSRSSRMLSVSPNPSRDLKRPDRTPPATVPDGSKRVVNRCSGCRTKVGLTGFRCRCGDLFCADHRYSDRHDCTYDYKAAGRYAIARENPVVKAAKIIKL